MAAMAGAPTSPGPGQVPHDQLRVTTQDREHVVDHVKAAYAEGRFDKFEFDDRLERAMTARTHGDLMPIMTELYGSRPAAHLHEIRPVSSPPRPFEKAPESNERLGAAASHLLSLIGFPIIGPLILLLTAGKTSPYVRRHATESLNFHLTVLGATFLLPFTVVGIVLLPVIWVGAMILAIVGGVAALAENDFRYPLTLRLVK
ncbi:DUF1707 and DUF4870 domain-containing protein [Nonomuraea sp. NBC_01738]|uniref:DUF1707 and DUF4870 domain-containing protein n=1 Tax=Nonomuraea sp. NBC_01738 TaxID=2976003 RepID=UPI002E11E042|nr:DUF1707 and DUF4870 domain-containing protein [Nonomuraea sp. NBC_01738]